ncbi:hypothetical protein [Schaalia suimastitidis]|uniref:hypothetical protein n=1 Tax=Schaalia suimastitidis TaxID=121163 RepID=UPI0013F3D390|nr:hypothetical protein [Schaalia suimastitidis]
MSRPNNERRSCQTRIELAAQLMLIDGGPLVPSGTHVTIEQPSALKYATTARTP